LFDGIIKLSGKNSSSSRFSVLVCILGLRLWGYVHMF
jgi:hypothetical protein